MTMITSVRPIAAPAELIKAVSVTLFFAILGSEDELSKGSNKKIIGDGYLIYYFSVLLSLVTWIKERSTCTST